MKHMLGRRKWKVSTQQKPIPRMQNLQREHGSWTCSDEELGQEVANYYNQLFCSLGVECLDAISHTISQQMNDNLTKVVEEEGTTDAVFSMNQNKSPAIDGMSPLFFPKFWYIIKNDIITAIQTFFHSGLMLKFVNHTVITLIPKVENPTTFRHYRPTSLCKVLQ